MLLCTNQGRPSVNKVPLGVTFLGQKLAQDMPLMKRGSCAKFGWDWLTNMDLVKEKPVTHTDTLLFTSSNDVTRRTGTFVYNLNIAQPPISNSLEPKSLNRDVCAFRRSLCTMYLQARPDDRSRAGKPLNRARRIPWEPRQQMSCRCRANNEEIAWARIVAFIHCAFMLLTPDFFSVRTPSLAEG
jgi:hypothetical protein